MTDDMVEYLAVPQSVHCTDPGVALYLPATQPMQLPFVPYQPALHEQSEILSLGTNECEFCGHERHALFWSLEYDPAIQMTQVSVTAVT